MPRDSATVSNNMRKIHSKDTAIELLLRKALWHKGYRYLEKGKNPDFWVKKIERNRNRDYENDKKLLFLGYTVLHFWGQDISKHTDECLQAIEEAIWDARFSDITTDYDISE